MLLINPYRFAAPRSSDADVNSYILAVEAADGQQLEAGVITAVENFVLGCKSDGIWSAIKASCILAGARTLSGALVPLVGTAPTNNNFVSADYNRETGLKGNGSSKWLNTNRNNNADPQNDNHNAAFITEVGTGFIMAGASTVINVTFSGTNAFSAVSARNRTNLLTSYTVTAANNYLIGNSRSASSSFNIRNAGSNQTATQSSQTPLNTNLALFASIGNGLYSNHRISFFSIGQSIDLAKLDTRVSNLMTALAAAIP